MATEMWDMIACAYEPIEANRFINWRKESNTLQAIGDIAYEIQEQLPLRPGACRYWTALWVKRVRSELGIPAVQVGGDLLAYDECVYKCSEQSEFLDPSHAEFEQRWLGHSWLMLGDLIGDISLVITAMDKTCQLTLKQAIGTHFTEDGEVTPVLGDTAKNFRKQGLLYISKGVYSDAAIERHIEVGMVSDEETDS